MIITIFAFIFPWLLIAGFLTLYYLRGIHIAILWEIANGQAEVIQKLELERDHYAELARISFQIGALERELEERESRELNLED